MGKQVLHFRRDRTRVATGWRERWPRAGLVQGDRLVPVSGEFHRVHRYFSCVRKVGIICVPITFFTVTARCRIF